MKRVNYEVVDIRTNDRKCCFRCKSSLPFEYFEITDMKLYKRYFNSALSRKIEITEDHLILFKVCSNCMQEVKKCPKCKKKLPIADFTQDNGRVWSECKHCWILYKINRGKKKYLKTNHGQCKKLVETRSDAIDAIVAKYKNKGESTL